MRFKSAKVDGLQVFAVSGTNTVTFGIDASSAARKGLLGFAVERIDPVANERYFMAGFKVFAALIPHPDQDTRVKTSEHPIQDFFWSDFTGKPGQGYEYLFYPVRGKPKKQERGKPVSISIKTEPLYSTLEHDIFFNRGVASSQAYHDKFSNASPDDLTGKKREAALQWLSRDLDEAVLKFIDQTKKGDTLLGCFYEFRYPEVAERLKTAIDRGVNVRLILDSKVNETVDKKGKVTESFPREENRRLVKSSKIPKARVVWREARASNIQHNKFMVLLKGSAQKPVEVWTGSTNLSMSGFHGQTNVGHWVRNAAVAKHYQAYWNVLKDDPGGREGDSPAEVRSKNKAFRDDVAALQVIPGSLAAIGTGISVVFSPQPKLDILNRYVDMVDKAKTLACITLAFGINKIFKEKLVEHPPKGPVIFMMLEKKDVANARAKDPFVVINAKNNIYKAWGSYLQDPLYQWARETYAKKMKLAQHISYVHSKFLLQDPLSDDPIVVTGSANFSEASTTDNDENMLIIRGNNRVADIYFTEFNRIFFHYYFRSVVEATKGTEHERAPDEMFLKEDPKQWLANYAPGKLRKKRLDAILAMKAFS
jgi:phosphatidylserine/phosphatidylglycerophosphate/cardiolipin synthase-like enzyme